MSLVGFILSLVVHTLASTGVAPAWGKYPFLLVGGVFVIGLPTVLAVTEANRKHPGRFYWWSVVWRAPLVERAATLLVFGYVVLNFVLFANGVYGPQQSDANAVRMISGHCLAFYWGYAMLLREPV